MRVQKSPSFLKFDIKIVVSFSITLLSALLIMIFALRNQTILNGPLVSSKTYKYTAVD